MAWSAAAPGAQARQTWYCLAPPEARHVRASPGAARRTHRSCPLQSSSIPACCPASPRGVRSSSCCCSWRWWRGGGWPPSQRYDHGLFVDEAQYIDWAREPAFGYYSKPPVLAWTIALMTGVCGEAPLCVRGGALLMYCAAAIFLFVAGVLLFDARVGLVGALLYFLSPGLRSPACSSAPMRRWRCSRAPRWCSPRAPCAGRAGSTGRLWACASAWA